MNGFIFPHKQENGKENFGYTFVLTIVAIMSGVSSEELKRQHLPKLEQYRLGTGTGSKKVRRGRKRGKKFSCDYYRRKALRLSHFDPLMPILKRRL